MHPHIMIESINMIMCHITLIPKLGILFVRPFSYTVRAEQNSEEQNSEEQNRTEQNRAEQSRAEQSRAEQSRT